MKRIVLDEYQKAVIVGSILGDAYLEKNWSKSNSRLGIRHSKNQEQYVQWMYEVLRPLVLTPPQHYERTHSVWFRTISHPELSQLHEIFYPDGKKIVPKGIAEYLSNPVTMATWFMDDGNRILRKRKIGGYHINTQSFSEEENTILAQTLENVYNIRCSVERNKGYYRLAIYQRESWVAFESLVYAHVIPSMRYKLVE